jgi:hypothetical protein
VAVQAAEVGQTMQVVLAGRAVEEEALTEFQVLVHRLPEALELQVKVLQADMDCE